MKVIRAGRPGVLVLDDVLMGLDLENRIPLLRLLDEDFSDWQTILLTHDRTWFELAREFTENKPMWNAKELFLIQGTDGSPPIPEIRDGCDPISRATAMIARGEYNPAANYLRIAFENTIKRACDHCKIEVAYKRNPKKITANDLWMGLCKRQKDREALQAKHPAKNHPDFIPQNLISRVNMIRSNILNGLSHDGSTNIQKAEVEAARDAIRDLSVHPFPPRND